jgi:hypothetical protein
MRMCSNAPRGLGIMKDAIPGLRPPRRTSSWAIFLRSLRELNYPRSSGRWITGVYFQSRSFDSVWRKNMPNFAQDDSSVYAANFRDRTPGL